MNFFQQLFNNAFGQQGNPQIGLGRPYSSQQTIPNQTFWNLRNNRFRTPWSPFFNGQRALGDFSFNPGRPTPDKNVSADYAPTPARGGGVPQTQPPFFNGGLGTAWGAVPLAQRNSFLPALQNGRRTYTPPQRVY